MNYKILALCLMAVSLVYRVFVGVLSLQSVKNPIPENVKDLYDRETYEKWRSYTFEKTRAGLVEAAVGTLAQGLLIGFGAYAGMVNGVDGVYAQSFAMIALFMLVDTVVSLPFAYWDTMVIEEKYGFNKSTHKTFFVDQLKQLIIMILVVGGLVWLLALIHQSLGDWVLVLFTGVMLIFVLAITFLNPVFTKIFNKFTPLEEGSLRQKLTSLLEKYGYRVRTIDVMDASRRTTKSNAYFTGFGKMKTIVLYDTLLSSMEEEEICAVFAHEMGHGIHKDTLKLQSMNMLQFALMSVLLWLTLRTPGIMESFGFELMNYGFAAILLVMTELPILQPLLMLGMCAYSRNAEYRADRQAVQDGYGESLISGLKKLSKDNLADLAPSDLLVKLEYTHPPISQRLAAIQAEMEKASVPEN